MKKIKKDAADNKKKKDQLPLNVSSVDDLERFELSGAEDKSSSTEGSETDDDEKEGSGDANIGRSVKDELG